MLPDDEELRERIDAFFAEAEAAGREGRPMAGFEPLEEFISQLEKDPVIGAEIEKARLRLIAKLHEKAH